MVGFGLLTLSPIFSLWKQYELSELLCTVFSRELLDEEELPLTEVLDSILAVKHYTNPRVNIRIIMSLAISSLVPYFRLLISSHIQNSIRNQNTWCPEQNVYT